MGRVFDVDQTGSILCSYDHGDLANSDPDASLKTEKTHVPLAKAIFYAFLPAGFPHTVTDDYLGYQIYDSLQAFSSSIASLLANRAVLEGLGVGDASQSPTAALVLKIMQDTISRLATIMFAHRMGTAIEPECKSYRFVADIFNDAAQILDLLVPVLPLLPKVSVLITSGCLRSLCGVAAGASKASLSAHFAKTGNLAELNAKEASQETLVSLVGMLTGTAVVHLVQDKTAVWCWMIILIIVHLMMNYRAVRNVRMLTLNRQRATIVFREFLETGKVLTPAQCAARESILRNSRGNMSSKSGEYHGFCDFGSYGDVMHWRPWGYHRYVFETDEYFMGIFHWRSKFYIRIAIKESFRDGRANGPLLAWFDAVAHAYHFDSALKDGMGSHTEHAGPAGYTSPETKETLLEALTACGWDVYDGQLEIKSPVRVRVADATKKGM